MVDDSVFSLRLYGKEGIRDAALRLGFSRPESLEKFVMDFEVQRVVSSSMECTTRGGMCMPFYTDETVRRLSFDVDLITPLSTKTTCSVMESVGWEANEMSARIHPPPRDGGYPIPNIVSYDVRYRSYSGGYEMVKIDFLCDVNIDLPVMHTKPETRVFDLSVDYSLRILSRGALIGDKLTTLALGQIGLPPKKLVDIPKQVYDISALLRSGDGKTYAEALRTFDLLTQFKVDHYESNPRYTVDGTIRRIIDSLHGLCDWNRTFRIMSGTKDKFSTFKGTYLGNQSKYSNTTHLTDILLVLLFTELTGQYYFKRMTADECACVTERIVNRLKDISKYNRNERRKESGRLYDSLQDIPLPFPRQTLKNMPLEHAVLATEAFLLARN